MATVEAPFLRLGSGELLRQVLSMYRGQWGLRPLAAASRHCRNAVRAHVRRGIWTCGGTYFKRICVATDCTKSLPVPWTRKLERHTTTLVDGCLVVVAGFEAYEDYTAAVAKVWRFDLVDYKWAPWWALGSWRHHHCSASVGGDVYVVSGTSGIEDDLWAPIEIISPTEEHRMRALTTMNPQVAWHGDLSKRSLPACSALGRFIYVAGGLLRDTWDRYSACDVNRVSRLDTETGEWVNVAPMRNVRRDFSLLAHGGYLYAIGGKQNARGMHYVTTDDDSDASSGEFEEVLEFERYNPERDEWEDLGRILPDHDRYSYSDVAAVADGRLWIICWRRIPQPGSPYAGRSFLARYDAASNTFLEGAEILGDSGGQTGELGNAAAVAAI